MLPFNLAWWGSHSPAYALWVAPDRLALKIRFSCRDMVVMTVRMPSIIGNSIFYAVVGSATKKYISSSIQKGLMMTEIKDSAE